MRMYFKNPSVFTTWNDCKNFKDCKNVNPQLHMGRKCTEDELLSDAIESSISLVIQRPVAA